MERWGWIPELFRSQTPEGLNGSEVEAKGPKVTLGVGASGGWHCPHWDGELLGGAGV